MGSNARIGKAKTKRYHSTDGQNLNFSCLEYYTCVGKSLFNSGDENGKQQLSHINGLEKKNVKKDSSFQAAILRLACCFLGNSLTLVVVDKLMVQKFPGQFRESKKMVNTTVGRYSTGINLSI